ncbi:unnamed protein product [Dovyalis caffra]|uniref:Uncharacterized protein n=1 Tax=Dovyalis caffra TaxID=77055 RepID=A0AAV1S2U8_9ROSI|nr:unnamed protein product [Dovyalis caffra]
MTRSFGHFLTRGSRKRSAEMLLGEKFKGYVFKMMGGCDKQGFPMKQGALTLGRVRILLHRGTPCFHGYGRRNGERRRNSVRGITMMASHLFTEFKICVFRKIFTECYKTHYIIQFGKLIIGCTHLTTGQHTITFDFSYSFAKGSTIKTICRLCKIGNVPNGAN